MNAETYSMQLGDNDTDRLTLLGQFYDPSSAAFLESAGVAEGIRLPIWGAVTAVSPTESHARLARQALFTQWTHQPFNYRSPARYWPITTM